MLWQSYHQSVLVFNIYLIVTGLYVVKTSVEIFESLAGANFFFYLLFDILTWSGIV